LRERLVRSLVAIGIMLVPALYFSSELYDILALPLMSTLPPGGKMIATGVITPFLIPMKIAAMAAFLAALPYVLYQAWAFVAPGCTRTRSASSCRSSSALCHPLLRRHGVLLLRGVRARVRVHRQLRAAEHLGGAASRRTSTSSSACSSPSASRSRCPSS
jgi:hypothetical protein